jgi:Secretion system C-terminal sorting domain
MYISLKHAQRGALALLLTLVYLPTIFAQSAGYASIHRDMVYNTSGVGDAYQCFDQDPATVFQPRHANGFDVVPAEVVLRLKDGAINTLTHINFHTAPGAKGRIQILVGQPGQWVSLSVSPLDYGNGITGLAWFPVMQNVRFIKAIFSQLPGDTQPLSTGELFFTLSGDFAYDDSNACPNGQAGCRTAKTTFDEYMGVNNFVGKTQLTHQFAPFTAVREYLPWDHVQGHMISGASIQTQDHKFRFSPVFPGYDLDRHYANLTSAGKDLLVDFKESSPFQMYFDYNGGHSNTLNQLGLSFAQLGSPYLDLMERKPGHPEGGVRPNAAGFNAPETYRNHAEALFQTSLRYGKNGSTAKHNFQDSPAKANQNTAKWIENWNEQDKWWNKPAVQAPVNGDMEKRLQFFTPKEYMAMTFADHKPKSGDLTLPLIMSGLAELDVEYLKGMYITWWELTGSDPALNGNWPFTAINYHHYSVKDWKHGIAPEKDFFIDGSNPHAHLSRITSFANKYLKNSEFWITEFGYSDHPQDVTSAQANYPNANYEEVQAQWILRSYLQYFRYGVDRAFAYQLVDDGPDQWHAVFNHTGFIDRTDAGGGAPTYKYKKAWYYTYTLRQHMAGMQFESETNTTTGSGRPLRQYNFASTDGQRKVSALWVPDDTNPAAGAATIATNGHKKVQVVRFTHEKIAGTSEVFEDHDNDGNITLSGIGEQPVLLIWDTLTQQVAECGCATDFTLVSGDQAAFSAISDKKGLILATEHPKCNYGPSAANAWESTQPETLTLNIGGGSATDMWQVDALYINDPAWNSGSLTLDLLDTAGTVIKQILYAMDGEPQYPYNTQGVNFVWKTFDGIATKAAKIRVQKAAGVRMGELILCAKQIGAQVTTPPVVPPVNPPAPPPPPPVTPPAPPTTNPIACNCAPFPVAPASVTYQLAAGQTLPSSQTLFSACVDQAPDKNPTRMFDEQAPAVLGQICAGQYNLTTTTPDYTDCSSAQLANYPISEWFPGWSNQYPYKAVVEFQQAIDFTGLFLYDSNDEGLLTFEYRESGTQNWKTLSINGSKNFKTSGYRKWRKVFEGNQILTASALRVTMHSQSARFSELAFCGPKVVRKNDALAHEADVAETNFEVDSLRQISAPEQALNAPSLQSEGAWRIYPNPADIFLTIDGIGTEITHFVLNDMTGRQLQEFASPGSNRPLTISVAHLPAGVYMLNAYAGEQRVQLERVLVK